MGLVEYTVSLNSNRLDIFQVQITTRKSIPIHEYCDHDIDLRAYSVLTALTGEKCGTTTGIDQASYGRRKRRVAHGE